jgi:UDP-N-acetylmuramyl pentapeptide phosphotransferase/UDP-N-acetylglucosamine-1-phosphate transferase
MHTVYYIILVSSVLLFASLFTLGAYLLMQKLAVMAELEERSNHSQATITGVGFGFIVAILSFLVVVNASPAVIIGGIVLLIISIMDDRAPLSVAKRFGFQLIAIILALHVFNGGVFQGLLPVWLDMALTIPLWLWFINAFNFMDGIDEISVIESVSITGGIVLLTLVFSAMPQPVEIDALVIGLGVAAFYPWNKHPAKCFMGDAGSIPLGYLLGYVLLALAASGQWAVALILPAYYLCDASLTLAKRAARKEPIFTAHSQHFYQQTVRAGRSHAWVAKHVGVLNIGLILLAGLALYLPEQAVIAIAGAYALSLLTCGYFARQSVPYKQLETHEVAL